MCYHGKVHIYISVLSWKGTHIHKCVIMERYTYVNVISWKSTHTHNTLSLKGIPYIHKYVSMEISRHHLEINGRVNVNVFALLDRSTLL